MEPDSSSRATVWCRDATRYRPGRCGGRLQRRVDPAPSRRVGQRSASRRWSRRGTGCTSCGGFADMGAFWSLGPARRSIDRRSSVTSSPYPDAVDTLRRARPTKAIDVVIVTTKPAVGATSTRCAGWPTTTSRRPRCICSERKYEVGVRRLSRRRAARTRTNWSNTGPMRPSAGSCRPGTHPIRGTVDVTTGPNSWRSSHERSHDRFGRQGAPTT